MGKLQDFVNVRQFKFSDTSFIIDSAISCLSKYKESFFKGWHHNDIVTHLEATILLSLNNFNYSIWVVCLKDDEDIICGYIIADTTTNHIFLQYTKYLYRKLGIQKQLLLPLVIDPTSMVTVGWATKEMLKLQKQGIVQIVNKFPMEIVKLLHTQGNK